MIRLARRSVREPVSSWTSARMLSISSSLQRFTIPVTILIVASFFASVDRSMLRSPRNESDTPGLSHSLMARLRATVHGARASAAVPVVM